MHALYKGDAANNVAFLYKQVVFKDTLGAKRYSDSQISPLIINKR